MRGQAMGTNVWMYGVMIASGISIPIMAAMNAGLGARIGVPASVTALLIVGALASAALIPLSQDFSIRSAVSAPAWYYLGGLVVAFYILSVTALGPKVGVGTAILCVLLGQTLSAALVDHFGWFGAPKSPIDLKKLIGLCLMVAGIWLARRTV